MNKDSSVTPHPGVDVIVLAGGFVELPVALLRYSFQGSIAYWYFWGWFNINVSSYQYRKFYCGYKTILQPSYLHIGISSFGRMTSLYWIGTLAISNF